MLYYSESNSYPVELDLGSMTGDDMEIPSEEECLALLEKYKTPLHITLHCRKVWEVGKLLGEGLLRRSHHVDLDLIRASCLLHDIGKFPCIVDGTRYHDVRGEQILSGEGHEAVARVVGQHVILKTGPDAPIAEEHVLFYADKRVVHDGLVSLDKRFEYLEETYGKTPAAIERLRIMKTDTMRLEKRIFLLLDFEPQDVCHLLP